jgi:hypothetical protein
MSLEQWKTLAEIVQSALTSIGIIAAGLWALRRYVFLPRIVFSVDVASVGTHGGETLIEVVGHLENKGLVPYRMRDLRFELRSLHSDDALVEGDQAINRQTVIPHVLRSASWLPANRDVYALLHPGASLRYSHTMHIGRDAEFLLVHGLLDYGRGLQLRADRLLKMPALDATPRPV